MLIIQCDFDDTITVGYISWSILSVFGPDSWRSMEEEYVSGKYSVEESNIRQFAQVRARKEDIEQLVLGEVVVRYAFDEFVEYCLGEGLKLVIVSSGLDLYVNPTLDQLGLDQLERHTAKTHATPDGIEVEYRDPSGSVITSGFKLSWARHFKERGDTVIYIGDGLSDIGPAQQADFVIARSTLEQHFRANDLPHYSFDTFTEVGKHVEEIRREVDG